MRRVESSQVKEMPDSSIPFRDSSETPLFPIVTVAVTVTEGFASSIVGIVAPCLFPFPCLLPVAVVSVVVVVVVVVAVARN